MKFLRGFLENTKGTSIPAGSPEKDHGCVVNFVEMLQETGSSFKPRCGHFVYYTRYDHNVTRAVVSLQTESCPFLYTLSNHCSLVFSLDHIFSNF